MLRDKYHALGRILSLCLLVGIIGILVFSFLKSREKRHVPPPMPRGEAQLGDQILAITEGYEYVSNVNGKLKFKVIAAKDTSYVSGRHELEQLTLIGFDDEGKENGQIKADRGETILEKNQVSFSGHVIAKNAEGLEVLTEELKYDTKAELATIDKPVQFKRDDLSGSSDGATLQVNTKKLVLLKNAHVVIAPKDPKDAPLDLKGDKAEYLQTEGIVKFSGNAAAAQGAQQGRADAITGFYRQDGKKLERVEARGNSSLQSQEKGKNQEIKARDLDFFFDEQQRLLRAVANGNATARSLEKDAPREISAERIEVQYTPREKTSEISTLITNGRTVMKITPQSRTEKDSERVIESDAVQANYYEGGKYLARAEATGNAVLLVTPLVATPTAESKKLTAPKFTAEFHPTGNDIKTFIAETNATAEFNPLQPSAKHGKRTLTGMKMTASFEPNTQEMIEMVVEGNAKLTEGDRRATATKGNYVQATRTVFMRGKPQVWDSVARTDATEIDANLETGESIARGRVRTTYYSQDVTKGATPFRKSKAPVFVAAERATFRHRESTAKYEGNARAWQDDNFIRGDLIEVDNGERMMSATGNAQSAIYNFEREIEKDKKEIVPVFGAADRIEYYDATKQIKYLNNVKIRQGTDQIEAIAADVTLDQEYKMTHFIARKNVVLTQPQRLGKGEQMEYTASTDEAILTGNLASLEDRERAVTSKGARLTLHLRDAKITANDEGGTKRVKTTHRIKKRS